MDSFLCASGHTGTLHSLSHLILTAAKVSTTGPTGTNQDTEIMET